MRTVLHQFRGYSRDLQLFLLFSLLVNTGFAVFGLVFNLYLYELGYREDSLGLFNGIQILALAIVSAFGYQLYFGRHLLVRAGDIPSPSPRHNALGDPPLRTPRRWCPAWTKCPRRNQPIRAAPVPSSPAPY